MAITRRTLDLDDALRALLQGVNDEQARALTAAWVAAWDEIQPDLHDALLAQLVAPTSMANKGRVTRAQLLRSLRLRNALAVVADRLEALAAEAGVLITGALDEVVDTAGAAQASIIDSQLPAGFLTPDDLATWSRVDPEQIAAIVQRSTEDIVSRLKPMPAEQLAIVKRELVRGVAVGSNPRATAARMIRRAEQVGFNGGLTRALNVARTETLDAYRAAAALGQAQHADVLAGWTWLARLDGRTCQSCWGQHGQLHSLEDAGPLDHQQGRCSRMATTKTWKDLGFDVEEPPSLLPDAAAEFEGLDAAAQLEVLGPARHAAWVSGDYPMETWSQRRTTDGWRDSFGASPAPQSSGGRSGRSA